MLVSCNAFERVGSLRYRPAGACREEGIVSEAVLQYHISGAWLQYSEFKGTNAQADLVFGAREQCRHSDHHS